MGCSPSTLRSITAASAAATMTPESTAWSRLPTTSSMVNVTAAMGALKAAAMPAAAPTGMSRRRAFGETPVMRPRRLAMPAQICTVGPSRPSDEPEPSWRAPTKNLPSESRMRRRPPRTAKAILTCGMPLPRALGTTYWRRTPHATAPSVGVTSVQPTHVRPGALMAWSMSACEASVMLTWKATAARPQTTPMTMVRTKRRCASVGAKRISARRR